MKKIIQLLVLSSSLFILGCGGSDSTNESESNATPIPNKNETITPPVNTPTAPIESPVNNGTTPVVNTPTTGTSVNEPTSTNPTGGIDTGAISTDNDTATQLTKTFENDTNKNISKEEILKEENLYHIAMYADDSKVIQEMNERIVKQQENIIKEEKLSQEYQIEKFNLLSNISYEIINTTNSKNQILKITEMPLEALPCENAFIATYLTKENQEINLYELIDFKSYEKTNYNGWFFITVEKILKENANIFSDNEILIGRLLSEKEIVVEPTKEIFENKAIEFNGSAYPILKLSSIKLSPMLSDLDYDCKEKVYISQKAIEQINFNK